MAGQSFTSRSPRQTPIARSGSEGGVLGWEFGQPISPGMDYRMARPGENDGGAIAGGAAAGQLQRRTSTLTTSTPRSRRCATSAGRPREKSPVPGIGWLAACKDTEGNAFGLWQGDDAAA